MAISEQDGGKVREKKKLGGGIKKKKKKFFGLSPEFLKASGVLGGLADP